MREHTLLKTTFAAAASFERQAQEAVRFIGSNPSQYIVDEAILKQILKRTETGITTPMTTLYLHLYDYYKGKTSFPFVNLYIMEPNVPEILTIPSVSFDCREVLKNKNPILDDVIVNLSQIVKIESVDQVKLTDLSSIQNAYVRAALCSSYNMTDDKLWLTPKMGAFICRTFAAILGSGLRNTYSIKDDVTMKKINVICTAYMSQMLEPESSIGEVPDLLFRSKVLPLVEINNVLSELKEAGFDFSRKYYMKDLAEMFKLTCGERLSKLDQGRMLMIFGAGSTDKTFTALSMEYPPYWVYTLIDIASGGRQAVYNPIFRALRIKEELSPFVDELNKYNEFFTSINRS